MDIIPSYKRFCCVGGQDYQPFEQVLDSITLTFNSNQQFVKRLAPNSLCVDVVILADDLVEGDEGFQLSISEDEEDVSLGQDTAFITILDNDSKKQCNEH